jgi:hypothetical protein
MHDTGHDAPRHHVRRLSPCVPHEGNDEPHKQTDDENPAEKPEHSHWARGGAHAAHRTHHPAARRQQTDEDEKDDAASDQRDYEISGHSSRSSGRFDLWPGARQIDTLQPSCPAAEYFDSVTEMLP